MSSLQGEDGVVAWVRRNAQTLSDLLPLRQIMRGVRIAGLGETTHGTREFFAIRQRILRYLVESLHFNVLAIEGSHAATRLVNDYVSGACGDRQAALTALGSVMWNVVEFGEVLDWLRDYNSSVTKDRHVHFLGTDIFHTRRAREQVLAWLERAAPSRVAATSAIFSAIAGAEAQGLLRAHKLLSEKIATDLRTLMESLACDEPVLVERTSEAEHACALRYIEVIAQWVSVYLPSLTPPTLPRVEGLNIYARSLFMADNLVHFIETVKRDARVVLWAHNFHVSVGFEDCAHGSQPNMGQRLREIFGQGYYALALELNRGEYLCREWRERGQTLGDLKVQPISPATEGSLPSLLGRAGDSFILDLRGAVAQGDVAGWLSSPQIMHCGGWACSQPMLTTQVVLKNHYDGVLFINETSATTPTAEALAAVAQGTGH